MSKDCVIVAIRRTHSQVTLGQPLTPIRTTFTKNIKTSKYWWACWQRGPLIPCWWKYKSVSNCGNSQKSIKKMKTELPYNPAIPFVMIRTVKLTGDRLTEEWASGHVWGEVLDSVNWSGKTHPTCGHHHLMELTNEYEGESAQSTLFHLPLLPDYSSNVINWPAKWPAAQQFDQLIQ